MTDVLTAASRGHMIYQWQTGSKRKKERNNWMGNQTGE